MAKHDQDELVVTVQEHLRGWNEISKGIRKQMATIAAAQRTIPKPVLEAQEKMRKALEPVVAHQEAIGDQLARLRWPTPALQEFPEAMKRALELQKAITDAVGPALIHLRETYEKLPQRTQEALLLLGEHGWYMDLAMDLPFLWNLEKTLAEGDQDEAEDLLVKHFEGRTSAIEEETVVAFPKRENLIRAAFNAHERGEYVLSIPVLLAQADGICKESAGHHFFMKKNNKPLTADYVERFTADSLTEALLSPLATSLPVAASERERADGFSALNRHMVVHGESLDYGTRINGLKAISLFNYVAQVLDPKEQYDKEAT